jgi:hypothetical protein
MNENDEKKLAGQLKRQLINCIGFEGDELANSRKQAYDYYFQRARGDEVKGRSEVVSGDLSAMVEADLAQMIEPLLAKRIAEYCAYSEEDEEQAQLEADCVQEMIFARENGFIELVSSIKDALLIRNGIVKIFVEERTHVSKVRRTNVAPEVVTDVLDKIGDVSIHKFDAETGTISATVKKTTRKFRVKSIAPENFLFPKNWDRQDLEGIPFCAERHVDSRSTLIELGFPKAKVEKLRRYNNPWQQATDSRLPRSVSPQAFPFDKSQELVEWYECYVMMEDEDGGASLHVISVSDKWILEDDEENTIVGYATGVAFINPHTFIGISLFDKLKSTQDEKTALTRALQDNLNATNKNRTAHFDGVVEVDDLTDGRVNGSIRVTPGVVPDVRMAVAAFQVPDTSANILANIQHKNSVRAEMGGAALDMASGPMQLNDRLGSQGLDRAYSVMEQLSQFMARMLAHTMVRSIYKVAHEVLRTQWPEVITFKRGKTWIKTNPSEWPVRESVKVKMGQALNERARLAAVLDSLMTKQILLATNGMEEILIDVQAFYNTLIDWMRINDIEIPERYLLDPRSPKAVAAFKSKHEQQAKSAEKQDAMIQQAIALDQVGKALEKYMHDSELQFKYWNSVLQAQVDEAKIATSGVIDLAKVRSDATAARSKADDNKGSVAPSSNEPSSESDANRRIGNAGT